MVHRNKTSSSSLFTSVWSDMVFELLYEYHLTSTEIIYNIYKYMIKNVHFQRGQNTFKYIFALQREAKLQHVLHIKRILNQLLHLLFNPVINDECHHKKFTKGTLRETVLIVLLWQQSQCCFWPVIICLWSFFFFFITIWPLASDLQLWKHFLSARNSAEQLTKTLMSYQRHKPLSVCLCLCVCVCVWSHKWE